MKELSELNFPAELRYTEDHEWAQSQGDTVRIGISDYAQDQLGDVVYVELPQVGDTFAAGDAFGTVESVKAVSELFMPIAGEVAAINAALADAPELVNTAPYDGGWMVDITPQDPSAMGALLDRDGYLATLKG